MATKSPGLNGRNALSPQEFIENESFRSWVYTNAPNDAAYWNRYLTQHPEYRESAELARTFLLAARGDLPLLSDQRVGQAVDQILSRAPLSDKRRARSLSGWTNWQPLRMAALVALLLGIGWTGWQYRASKQTVQPLVQAQTASPAATALLEIRNEKVVSKLVRLADGSLVILQQNARIRFPRQFSGAKRDVFLTGNAFFEVVKNPAKPFRVFTGDLTTEVLGTSFLINAPETGGTVKVVVKTGRVAVSANQRSSSRTIASRPKPATVILLPNQQVTFSKNDAQLVKRDVSPIAASSLPATTQLFTFRRTPLPQVLDALEKAYGIDIRYNSSELSGCTLTARLDDPSLFARLDVIAASTGSTYELINGQLVIHSSGCR